MPPKILTPKLKEYLRGASFLGDCYRENIVKNQASVNLIDKFTSAAHKFLAVFNIFFFFWGGGGATLVKGRLDGYKRFPY